MKRLSICLLLAMICMAGYAQETGFSGLSIGTKIRCFEGKGAIPAVSVLADFHFELGGERGEKSFDFKDRIPWNSALTQQLYEDFSKTLEENLQMKTDMHEVQQKVAKHNIARYLKTKTEANVLLLTVSYDLMIFNKHVYEAIINVADVLNRNLETHKPTGIHLEEYKRRPVEAEYWRKLYLPELS